MNAVYVIFVFVECGSRFQLHKMSLVPFSANEDASVLLET